MLADKKILLGITGSIAAYKTIQLVRLLVKQKATVKVVMTSAARDFVSPLVLSTLSGNEVHIEIAAENTWANHVQLGRWADIMLIAPLSCNTLAKMAYGFCDNLLLSVYLSATCPIIVAPAMDMDMWHHSTTKKNIQLLQNSGHYILHPKNGELASGLFGLGRMEEPEAIVQALSDFFANDKTKDLTGKKILITAGPTHESIDPVRFIGNHSSGKMGLALAKECLQRGATVTLILGPIANVDQQPFSGITIVNVITAAEMYDACIKYFNDTDIILLAAAVADFRPVTISNTKVKKEDGLATLNLVKTKDILKSLGAIKTSSQILLGFALETNDEEKNALKKLKEKHADLIVLNSLQDGTIFGSDHNKINIYSNRGDKICFEAKDKSEVAADIMNTVLKHIHKQA